MKILHKSYRICIQFRASGALFLLGVVPDDYLHADPRFDYKILLGYGFSGPERF